MPPMFRALWNYRHFVVSAIRTELISRFARSRLGGLWMIVNPLAQVAIYALILSNVLGAKLPGVEGQYAYAAYLMAGLLAWTLFSDLLSRCVGLFIDNGNLIKKMSFPRITLPAIATGSTLLTNVFLLLAMLGVFLLLGHPFSWLMLWVVPLTLLLLAFTLGLGLVLGIMHVFMRDIGHIVGIALQMWFWLTPIVYPIAIIPAAYQGLFHLNPLYPLVSAYQSVLVYGQPPELAGLAVIALLSALFLMSGLFLFNRAHAEMVDAL